MSRLSENLDELVAELTRVGSPIGRYLRSPLEAGAVDEALRPLGLSPSTEVVDWFGWHDGVDYERYSDDHPGAGPLQFFFALEPARLADAVRVTRDMRVVAADLQTRLGEALVAEGAPWDQSWLPLLFGAGTVICASCPGVDGATSDVWRAVSHPGPVATDRIAPSIGALVEMMIAELRAGSVWWDRGSMSLQPKAGEEDRLDAMGLT